LFDVGGSCDCGSDSDVVFILMAVFVDKVVVVVDVVIVVV
jgi:hypothetical protein